MLTIFEYSGVVESLLTPCHKVPKNSKWTFHTSQKNLCIREPYDGTTQVKGKIKKNKKNRKENFYSYISSLNTPCALLSK